MASSVRKWNSFRFPRRRFHDETVLHTNFKYMEDFLKNIGENTGQTPDVIFAPSNNPTTEHGNISLPGSADDVKIQTELDKIDADGVGGWIHFLPGTVNISTMLELTATTDDLLITGSGYATIWSASAVMDSFINGLGSVQQFIMRDITLDGNSNAVYCMDRMGDFHIMDRVQVKNATSHGVFVGPNDGTEITNCWIHDNGGYGIGMYYNQFCKITDNFIEGNTDDGIRVTLNNGQEGIISGNQILNNGGWGINHRQGNILTHGNVLDNNTSGDITGTSPAHHNYLSATYTAGDHTGVDHGTLAGLTDDDHTQYLLDKLSGGVAAEVPVHTHASEPEGGQFDHVNAANIGTETHTEIDQHLDHFNGSFLEHFAATVTSDGATVTMALAKTGGGNLTTRFSTGNATYTAGNIALTAGTDVSPQVNYIYILAADSTTLVKSTSAWPATEHIKVGFFFVPSAGFVQTNGVYINQNWNDAREDSTAQGHMTHIGEHLRHAGAVYFSGVDGNGTDGYFTPTAGNVELISTAGVVYQLHKHTVPAFDTSSGGSVLVKNWSGTAYNDITNLYDIVADSTGSTITNNKFFNVVIWGVANKGGEYAPRFINLPSGFYNTQTQAEADTSGYDDFTIPREFNNDSSTGFLICRVTIQMKTGGGTWVIASSVDLRGQNPISASGGASAAQVEFPDNTFRIQDQGDLTKELAFESSGITTGTTRTVTVQDADGTMALLGGTIDHGTDLTGLTDDDHTQYMLKTILTTEGDIMYRNATVPTRLAIGTAGKVLAVNSGATAPEWVDNPPSFPVVLMLGGM